MPETTSKHFEVFQREVRRCINLFGLLTWRVHIEHGPCENSPCRAECYYDVSNRSSTITLNTEWDEDDKINNVEIKVSARHEVIHLIICRLAALGMDRYVSQRDFQEEQEALVRLLHRLIFGENDMVITRGKK